MAEPTPDRFAMFTPVDILAPTGRLDLGGLMPNPPGGSATDVGSSTISILKALGDLQNSPLVPSDNPLLQMGTILSGFSSGLAGKANPVLAQLSAQRAQDIQTGLAGAGMQLNVDTARSTAQHQRAQLESEEANRLLRTREFAGSMGSRLITEGKTLGSTDMVEQGYAKWAEAGILPAGLSDPGAIKKAAGDTISRAEFEKRAAHLAALFIAGQTTDPEIQRYAPNWLKHTVAGGSTQADEEAFRGALAAEYKLPADINGYLAQDKAKTLEAQTKVIAQEASLRVTKAINEKQSPNPTDMILSMQGKGPEALATMGIMLKNAGIPLPATLQSFVENYNKHMDYILRSGDVELRIKELTRDLEQEKLNLSGVTALGAYVDKLKTLTGAMANTLYIMDPAQKAAVLGPLNRLLEQSQKELLKKYPNPVTPEPAGGQNPDPKAKLLKKFNIPATPGG